MTYAITMALLLVAYASAFIVAYLLHYSAGGRQW